MQWATLGPTDAPQVTGARLPDRECQNSESMSERMPVCWDPSKRVSFLEVLPLHLYIILLTQVSFDICIWPQLS